MFPPLNIYIDHHIPATGFLLFFSTRKKAEKLLVTVVLFDPLFSSMLRLQCRDVIKFLMENFFCVHSFKYFYEENKDINFFHFFFT